MNSYSQSYKAFSKAILPLNEKIIREWAKSPDKELSDSCKMIIEAASED